MGGGGTDQGIGKEEAPGRDRNSLRQEGFTEKGMLGLGLEESVCRTDGEGEASRPWGEGARLMSMPLRG